MYSSWLRFRFPLYSGTVSCNGLLSSPPCAESPFAHSRCYLSWRDVWRHIGRHYPPLHRSYWLMRQAKTLSSSRFYSWSMSLCRLLQAPAGSWSFPTLFLQSLRRRLDPYPAVSLWCACSLLPRGQRPHIQRHTFGTLKITPIMQLQQGKYSRGCSHSLMFRLPRSLAPQVAPTAKELTL